MKKLLLILVLAPLFIKAQYRTPKDYTVYSLWAPKINGHVKSVKVIASNLKDMTPEKLFNPRNSANKTNTTIYNYNKNGDIDSILYFNDSLNIISHKYIFVYDKSNNLTEVYKLYQNGKKRIDEGYGYDSLNRWVETKYYDSLNNYRISNFREYKSNDSIIYYNTVNVPSEKCKTVEIYQKNMITTISYYSNNKDIYYKSTEIVDGDKKSKISQTFNQKDGALLRSTEEYFSPKKSYWQFTMYCSDGSVCSYENIKYKYNEQNDIIESKKYRSFKKTYSDVCIEKLKLTFKYEYDTHGNFVKKIGQNSDKTTFETIRTIEYYD